MIKQFIRAILLEKLRSKTFSMNELLKLKNEAEVLNYAFDNLEQVGDGSARDVFILSSGKVLKVAKGKVGIAQNKLEEAVSRNNRTSNIVAHVLSSSPEGFWLISELVKPFDTAGDITIMKKLGLEQVLQEISFEDFFIKMLGVSVSVGLLWLDAHEIDFSNEVVSFFQNVSSLQAKTGLSAGDLAKPSSYGQAPDGRICVLDYGLNPEIYHTYYGKGWG
jgi:hypothetical protein